MMPDLFHPVQIAIDGNEANRSQRVGSNVYAFELLRAMEHLTATKKRHLQVTVFLSSEPVADLPAARLGWRYRAIGPRFLWTQLALPLYLFVHQPDFDVFFTPGHYAPRWCALPYISSVMDLAFIKYPELFRLRDLYQLESWTRYSVKHATKVVCISRFTRSEVNKIYGRANVDLLVAYPALASQPPQLPASRQAKILRQWGVGQSYFLYLGTLQPRKNILRLIEAFEQLLTDSAYQDYQLVLAGKNGWLTGEIDERLAHSPVRDRIILTGFVTDEQKVALLRGATATLNLGFYEGFGIPALESLACETIPIVANNTSLPEVVGSVGLSVNPYRVESITRAMQTATHFGRRDRDKFRRLARAQVAKFSYQKSADLILTALAKQARLNARTK